MKKKLLIGSAIGLMLISASAGIWAVQKPAPSIAPNKALPAKAIAVPTKQSVAVAPAAPSVEAHIQTQHAVPLPQTPSSAALAPLPTAKETPVSPSVATSQDTVAKPSQVAAYTSAVRPEGIVPTKQSRPSEAQQPPADLVPVQKPVAPAVVASVAAPNLATNKAPELTVEPPKPAAAQSVDRVVVTGSRVTQVANVDIDTIGRGNSLTIQLPRKK